MQLTSAFLAIAPENVLLDPDLHLAIATDGESLALLPLPSEFRHRRLIAAGAAAAATDLLPDSGTATDEVLDPSGVADLAGPPAYRIAVDPARLLALAAALGAGGLIVLELSATPGAPIRVLPADGAGAMGYLMPPAMPFGDEGLVGKPGEVSRPAAEEPPAATLPPPIVIVHAGRKTIEVTFGGRPDKEILKAIGREGLGFSYSGRGTKRGVPPATWYAPDNPFFRGEIGKLLGVEIQQIAA